MTNIEALQLGIDLIFKEISKIDSSYDMPDVRLCAYVNPNTDPINEAVNMLNSVNPIQHMFGNFKERAWYSVRDYAIEKLMDGCDNFTVETNQTLILSCLPDRVEISIYTDDDFDLELVPGTRYTLFRSSDITAKRESEVKPYLEAIEHLVKIRHEQISKQDD